MTDINHIALVGRLTNDINSNPKAFSYLQDGKARAFVSIAVNRSQKKQDGSYTDDVSFFDVVIWGKLAENLKPYLTKGKQIAVDGYLKQDRWQKDGQKFSRVTIVANNIELLGGKAADNQANNQQGFQQNENNQYSGNQSPQNDFPEDIPF